MQARACWPHLSAILAISLLSTPLALLLPLPLKIAVDSGIQGCPLPAFLRAFMPAALQHSSSGAVWIALVLLVLISLLVLLLGMAGWILQTYTGEKLVWNFRADLLHHAQRLSLSFHDRRGSHDLSYRIQHDAPSIQYVAIQGVIPFASAVFTLLAVSVTLFKVDTPLALIAAALVPPVLVLTRACGARVREHSYKIKDLDSSALSVAQEALTSIRVVKAFGRESREYERFITHSGERMKGQVRLALLQSSFNLLIGMIIALGTAATMFVGVLHVRSGRLTVGDLLLVMAYLAQLYSPLQLISTKLTDIQAWMASLERAFSLLDEVPEIDEHPRPQSLAWAHGEIEFCSVALQYGNDRPAVKDISFHVSPGQKVGIIGPSGAGKSTLLNLLVRFYDPTAGRVLLDGIDLREYRIADLRRQFSIVLQEPILFSTTIGENIAYGRPDASDNDIITAAVAANAHDFISRLPQGYDTIVGERGSRLSGGERQRISLARAFLRNSSVLILDEPTSSVDTQTEELIMDSMKKLMHGRTAFMIAHRLNTLENCELLLVVNGGKLVGVTENVSSALQTHASHLSAEEPSWR